MLFSCPSVARIWYTLNPVMPDELVSFPNILLSWANSHDNSSFLHEICMMWLLWFRRNKFLHENFILPDDYYPAKCRETMSVLFTNVGNDDKAPVGQRDTKTTWQKPPTGYKKINANARLSNEGWIGLGAISRNEEGVLEFVAV